MRSVSAPNGRVNKATLLVDHYADEVLIYASGPPGRALLPPALRKQLAEIAAAEMSWAALPPVAYESVEDIQPQPDRRALPAPRAVSPAPADRDQAIDQQNAATSTGAASGANGDQPAAESIRKLNQPARDELKRLCGGAEDANGRFTNLERFRELVRASYQALGVPRDPFQGDFDLIDIATVPEPQRGSLDFLTTAHAAWIRAHHEDPEPSATGPDDDRDPDDDSASVVQGELLEQGAQ